MKLHANLTIIYLSTWPEISLSSFKSKMPLPLYKDIKSHLAKLNIYSGQYYFTHRCT